MKHPKQFQDLSNTIAETNFQKILRNIFTVKRPHNPQQMRPCYQSRNKFTWFKLTTERLEIYANSDTYLGTKYYNCYAAKFDSVQPLQ